ncbi:MAG: hypothetical protein H0V76_06910, partial [Blastocatellia bacterium]|nr:hypothetical protein [Blastocatellia bacterium]
MTINQIQDFLRQQIVASAQKHFDITPESVAVEIPPRPELGDMAFPVAFELAKLIKQTTGEKHNPRALAEAFKSDLESVEFVDHIDIAGPGYLNVF